MIFIQREKSLFYKQILQMLDISPPKTKQTKHIYTLKKKKRRDYVTQFLTYSNARLIGKFSLIFNGM